MKSITKPTSGFLKIVNGEYLTPTYTPPTPPTNNPSNDPTIERVEVQTISSDGTLSAINLKVKLVNNDTKLLTFYAHASTESNVSFYDLSTTWASNKKSVDLSANSELSSHTFKFDHVGLKNGSVVSISDNQSLNNPNPPSMYYIYVFVTDSDDEEFTYNESITINR